MGSGVRWAVFLLLAALPGGVAPCLPRRWWWHMPGWSRWAVAAYGLAVLWGYCRAVMPPLWRGARGLCPRCGYDLRASPERCPECGAAPEGRP